MIKKILRIKNLGIFSNYQCLPNLSEFKRFNLFYGWNGSGKSTLTNFFALLNEGKSLNYPDLEYKISTSDGDFIQNEIYKKKIRVFNQNYKNKNIDIIAGKANPIFILGEDNIELAEKIKNDENVLDKQIRERDIKTNEIKKKENEKGDIFSNTAKIIGVNTSGASLRNYRKNNAEKAFYELGTKQILSNDEMSKYVLTLKQLEKPTISEILVNGLEDSIVKIIKEIKIILESTVETILIERLQKNSDISIWVETGLQLHKKYKSDQCEFCNQKLPENLLSNLLLYFNDADKKLKDDLDALYEKIDQIIIKVNNISIIDKANFYDELQTDYQAIYEKYILLKNDIIEKLRISKNRIVEKKSRTTEIIKFDDFFDFTPLKTILISLNEKIKTHNDKTNNFAKEKEKASDKIEKHYLSEISDDIQKMETDIKILKNEIVLLENGDSSDTSKIGIKEIQERIKANKNKISTSGIACDEINRYLKTFLGRDELFFELDEGSGYTIKRQGKIANNLSEGEKTAITLIYFIIHLKDQDFSVNDGIIVIDDPICSFDSNSLFQAFSFIKNSVKAAYQVFLFTHNYDFLRLLLNWLIKSKEKHEFFMIKNKYQENKRISFIDNLDQLLQKYESEYNYLVMRLYEFKDDGTIESVYDIPNIARKVLEYFLLLMVPNSESMYGKLEKICFDDMKKTAIYKFANDESHFTSKNFDPSLIPECQKNISYLLEMIKTVFPQHWDVLEKTIIQ
jgi:wobble nucleotide-excising tRNase